jgi:hypothetical protein
MKVAHYLDAGIWWLDQAAIQKTPEWTAALADLGRAYVDAATAAMAVGDRLGLMGKPPVIDRDLTR